MSGAQPNRAATAPRRPAQPDELIFAARCSQERRYDIHLVDDLFAPQGKLADVLAKRRTLIVTTPTVWANFGSQFGALRQQQGIDTDVLVIDVEESSKSAEIAMQICRRSHELELGRKDALLSLGGGVCHDVVSVASSLIRRGIAHVSVPTTLVGQIDAGIGIKGAVNFRGSKSYLGAFHPPDVVLIHPPFLHTAPARTWTDGISEIIKIGLTTDASLIESLEAARAHLRSPILLESGHSRAIMRAAIQRMLEQLATNFFEDQTYERLVDFGHTFSGMIEESSGYGVSHGQAVAMDMALSASIAVTQGMLAAADFTRILSLLEAAGLPTQSPHISVASCADALRATALHRGGKPNLVVPTGIGTATFLTEMTQLDDDVLGDAIRRIEGRPSAQNR